MFLELLALYGAAKILGSGGDSRGKVTVGCPHCHRNVVLTWPAVGSEWNCIYCRGEFTFSGN